MSDTLLYSERMIEVNEIIPVISVIDFTRFLNIPHLEEKYNLLAHKEQIKLEIIQVGNTYFCVDDVDLFLVFRKFKPIINCKIYSYESNIQLFQKEIPHYIPNKLSNYGLVQIIKYLSDKVDWSLEQLIIFLQTSMSQLNKMKKLTNLSYYLLNFFENEQMIYDFALSVAQSVPEGLQDRILKELLASGLSLYEFFTIAKRKLEELPDIP